jgi:hypothetical protein
LHRLAALQRFFSGGHRVFQVSFLLPSRSRSLSSSCAEKRVNSSISNSKRFALAFLAVFVGGIFTFALGSELLIRYAVAPTDAFEHYKAEFRTTRAPAAAFGDSHVAAAIESTPDIVNLGYPAETLPLMMSKVRAYVALGHAKRAIVQLSPQQFAIYRADNRQDELADELFGRSESWLKFIRPHFRHYLLEYWSSLIKDPGRLIGSKAKAHEVVRSEPVRFSELPAHEQRNSAEIRVQLHMPLPSGRIVDQLTNLLFSTLDDIRSYGVDVCIVEYPVSSLYRNATERAPSFQALRTRVHRLARDHGIPFVDITDRISDTLFADPDHVAEAARGLVTRLVLAECFGSASDRGQRLSPPQ